MEKQGKDNPKKLEKKALKLFGPTFLFKAGQKIGELGVVGEPVLRLILFLAAITRTLEDPVSVMVKGSTSAGKTTIVRKVLQLFSPGLVIERAGLSGKALAYGGETLHGKILFINEYRCGKDAQQLLRLIQSGEEVHHEATVMRGARRTTETVDRTGSPPVLTTNANPEEVFADDETRFLSVWVDESTQHTKAILRAQVSSPPPIDGQDLQRWRTATSMLQCRMCDFRTPEEWLQSVFSLLPAMKVRVRRDAKRFHSLLKAVALCGSVPGGKKPIDIKFSDYCVAYTLFEPVFASTLRGVPTREVEVAKAVRALTTEHERAVTTEEVARFLRIKKPLCYRYVKRAVKHGLIQYETGTRVNNAKPLLPSAIDKVSFLPSPQTILNTNPQIVSPVNFIDPLTGEEKVLHRKKNGGKS